MRVDSRLSLVIDNVIPALKLALQFVQVHTIVCNLTYVIQTLSHEAF
jgi:hypothetical protein